MQLFWILLIQQSTQQNGSSKQRGTLKVSISVRATGPIGARYHCAIGPKSHAGVLPLMRRAIYIPSNSAPCRNFNENVAEIHADLSSTMDVATGMTRFKRIYI